MKLSTRPLLKSSNFDLIDLCGVGGIEESRDATYFAKLQGLRNSSIDPIVLTWERVIEEEIEKNLDKKFNKNSWKLDRVLGLEQQSKIKEMYCRVTGKKSIVNKTTNLKLAGAIVSEAKGLEINWAIVVANSFEYCIKFKQAKDADT